MTERVLLIDTDSTIPNLALMKLSTYWKAQSAEVGFGVENPTRIYDSIVFTRDAHLADGLRFYYPHAEIDLGGTGYDLHKTLPPEVEDCNPDYSLYPEMDYSLGFSSRGCIRNCSFCFVPRKEGKFRRYKHPREWYNPAFRKIVFLDNNILADRDWFFEVTDWVQEKKLRVEFNQGLDIRLMTPEIAQRITELHPIRDFNFAYDNKCYRSAVKRGIELLTEAGFNMRSKSHVYVYCHGDDMYEDAVERCKELKSWNATPFVMVDPQGDLSLRVKRLRRWGTRSWYTWSCDPEDFWYMNGCNRGDEDRAKAQNRN